MHPRLLSDRNVLAGIIFVAVGAAFSLGALNYKLGSADQPGPGYFPFGLGIILAILGATLLFRIPVVRSGANSPVTDWAWKPLILIVGAVIVFAVLLPRAGLLVALPVLIVMSAMAGDEFRWREAIISAAVITSISWLLFVRTLRLEIPLLPNFVM